MARFSLRTMLVLVAAAAVVSAVVAHYFFRPDPVTYVTTWEQWDAATRRGRCVVMFRADWCIDSALTRGPFDELADIEASSDIRFIMVLVGVDEPENDAAEINKELCQHYRMNPGGLKNYGGAGRVLWLEDGRVVDAAWGVELLGSRDELREVLRRRTEKAFP